MAQRSLGWPVRLMRGLGSVGRSLSAHRRNLRQEDESRLRAGRLQANYMLGGAALLFLALATPGAIAAGEEPVITADVSAWCGTSWRAEVYQSGYAHLRVQDSCVTDIDRSTLTQLSETQIAFIRSAVERFGFCKLPERIEPETIVTDEEVIFVTSHFRGQMCEVSGFGLERYPNRDVVDRFNEVLCAIAAVVPGIPEW